MINANVIAINVLVKCFLEQKFCFFASKIQFFFFFFFFRKMIFERDRLINDKTSYSVMDGPYYVPTGKCVNVPVNS